MGSLWKYNLIYITQKKKQDLVSWNLSWIITMESLAACIYRGAPSSWSLWGPTHPAGCPLQSCCAHTSECYKGTHPLQILKASHTTRQSKTTEQSIRLLFLTGVQGKIRLGSRSRYAALALGPYAPVDQWCSQSLCQTRCCFEWLASLHRTLIAQTPRGLLPQLAVSFGGAPLGLLLDPVRTPDRCSGHLMMALRPEMPIMKGVFSDSSNHEIG